MLGNGFAGSENMAESRFAAALPIIILLSNVEVAILNNIQNFHLPPHSHFYQKDPLQEAFAITSTRI
jgi:hypothetical protein